jgi:hypothetical protein
MNLNDFEIIFCANFIQRYFAQKTVNLLVLLKINNMKRLLIVSAVHDNYCSLLVKFEPTG